MRDPLSFSHSLKRQDREVRKLRPRVTYSVAEVGLERCWLVPEPTHSVLHCDKLIANLVIGQWFLPFWRPQFLSENLWEIVDQIPYPFLSHHHHEN